MFIHIHIYLVFEFCKKKMYSEIFVVQVSTALLSAPPTGKLLMDIIDHVNQHCDAVIHA